jgi:putative hemolysin
MIKNGLPVLVSRSAISVIFPQTVTEPESEIKVIDSATWEIKGTVPLEEVAEATNTELPTEEYDTFGGFVFGFYGSVPDDGTVIEVDACGLHIKVLEILDHRVERALVCKEASPDNQGSKE